MTHPMLSRLVRPALIFVLAACGTPGTRPDDMSAEEHRARAAEERQQAAEHEAHYDPNAHAASLETAAGDVTLAPQDYNPTHWQHEAAEAHERTAEKHLAAARTLEDSEDAACTDIPPAARGACPLLSPVSVTDLANGVKVTFPSAEGATRAAAVIRCQQAYARTHDYKDLPTCILYAKNLDVALDGTVVKLTSTDPNTMGRLAKNVRAHAPHPAP